MPLLVAFLLRVRFLAATSLYASLGPAAIAIIIYGVAAATGGNLYLAAFSAGITLASAAPELRDSFVKYGEYIAEIVKLLAIFVFGALIAPSFLGGVSVFGYLFAVLILVIARPIAVEVSLIGSKLPWEERATAAWFGPKGFASVLYGLLVLESGNPDSDHRPLLNRCSHRRLFRPARKAGSGRSGGVTGICRSTPPALGKNT